MADQILFLCQAEQGAPSPSQGKLYFYPLWLSCQVLFSWDRLGVKSEFPPWGPHRHLLLLLCREGSRKAQPRQGESLAGGVSPQLPAAGQPSLAGQGRCSCQAVSHRNTICLLGQQNRFKITQSFVSRRSLKLPWVTMHDVTSSVYSIVIS